MQKVPALDRADLELLLAIRDRGGMAVAATALDVVPSVVTRRLADLEARLGLRLFQRTTRRVAPTAEGAALCERAAGLLAQFRALEGELQDQRAEPAGLIRLAATFGFGRRWVGPALAEFQRRHPQVQVQLQLTEQLPDLGTPGLDGAVWLWPVRGPRAAQWSGRRLARNQRVLVAAPAYLKARGTPDTLEALAGHDCLLVRESDQRHDTWLLRRERERSDTPVRVQGPLSSNSGELVRDWCLAGHGIMLRSLWDVAPLLSAGRLVRVLPAWSMADADIHWLAPWQPRTPRRIRLLVEFLAERFQAEPWKQPLSRGRGAPPG